MNAETGARRTAEPLRANLRATIGWWAIAAAAASSALPSPSAPPAAGDAWRTLEEVRSHRVAAGPAQSTFTQEYIPTGFASGDRESGTLALALPDCLRFHYSDPYPKNFLVCGGRAYAWVDGETRGDRRDLDAREEAGLDLLLLPIETLRTRYRASATTREDGAQVLRLEPLRAGAPIVDSELVLEAARHAGPGGGRLTELSYRDGEGNRTRFVFGDFSPLADPRAFAPPAGIDWKTP